jgi:hypothetical protein
LVHRRFELGAGIAIRLHGTGDRIFFLPGGRQEMAKDRSIAIVHTVNAISPVLHYRFAGRSLSSA